MKETTLIAETTQWYVIQVLTGAETECLQRLTKLGIKAVAPTRILPELSGGVWRERERMMIPGYVFAQMTLSIWNYYRVTQIPCALRILPGNGEFHPVPEKQMRWILEMTQDGAAWGISTAAEIGGRIVVRTGPLLGREKNILKWDKRRRRCTIRIGVLDERRKIDVGLIETE